MQLGSVWQIYFANFIKTGNPNGPGLLRAGQKARVMHIDVNTRARPQQHRERYLLLDRLYKKGEPEPGRRTYGLPNYRSPEGYLQMEFAGLE